MKILSAITVALPVHVSTVHAVPIGGMTRQRFQASIHTLIDDEMALILESSSAIGNHRRTKSRTPKQAAASSAFDGIDWNETLIDVSIEMDDLFDSIVAHGWDTILSRSSHEEELFLVCLEMPASLGVDRMQVIMDALKLDSINSIYLEPIHSTVDGICVIMSIPTDVALNWYNSNDSSVMSLTPWVDAMKVTPGIVSRLATVDTASYSVVFSIAQNGGPRVDGILADVIQMAMSGQSSRRQLSEEQTLLQLFSLTKSPNHGYWSRMLTEYEDCSSMFDRLVISSLNDNVVYQISFDSSDASETCIVSLLVRLAIHPTVTRVGTIEDRVELHNLHASWVVQGSVTDLKGNDFFPFSAAGLDGRSQLVSISDTGLDLNNCYFRDSDDSDDGSIFNDWDLSKRKILRYDHDRSGGDYVDLMSGHGTHVSGTIIGSHLNGLGHEKDGIAPAAKAHFFDICTANRCLSPTTKWFDSLSSNGNSTNIPKVLAASWGTNYLSSYDYTCQQYDRLVYENPDIVLISSAGNNGERFANPFATIGAPASCKNTLAVGATFNSGFGQSGAVASFSSRGPSSDGRIKPDLLAPGFRLSSAIAGHHDCHLGEAEFLRAGTSMAQPVVSGAALLIRQYFEEAFYPCGYKGCGQSLSPSGSLVKAVLVNGAQVQHVVTHASYGYIKTDQPLSPYDNTQGFGAANLMLSLPLRNTNDFGIFVKDKMPLRFGQYHSFELSMDLNDCKSDFSVTLAWTDPPATIGCTSCLVNDLDLVVEDVGLLVKHYPNGRITPDRVNNVERVRIDNAHLTSGQKFRVKVTANHIGPQVDLQRYSLVATGCFSSPESQPEHHVSTHSAQQLTFATKNYRLMSKRRASGLMFAVKARTHGVVINSFSITTHLTENSRIFVYKLNDMGLLLNETELNDETAWQMISPQSGFEVNATGTTRDLTVLPFDAFEVPISKGSFQAFYITFENVKGIVCGRPRWSSNKEARERKRDNNVKIEQEIGRPRLFSGRIIDPCYLDGSVKYSIQHLFG